MPDKDMLVSGFMDRLTPGYHAKEGPTYANVTLDKAELRGAAMDLLADYERDLAAEAKVAAPPKEGSNVQA